MLSHITIKKQLESFITEIPSIKESVTNLIGLLINYQIESSVTTGEKLEDGLIDRLTPNQQIIYITNRMSLLRLDGSLKLGRKEFNLCSEEQKLMCCTELIDNSKNLETYQFAWAPDEIKLTECNNRIEMDIFLMEHQFAWVSDDMKLISCIKSIEKNGKLISYQFAWVSDEMKLADCYASFKSLRFLLDYQFAWAPDEMKVKSCQYLMKNYGFSELDTNEKEWYNQYQKTI